VREKWRSTTRCWASPPPDCQQTLLLLKESRKLGQNTLRSRNEYNAESKTSQAIDDRINNATTPKTRNLAKKLSMNSMKIEYIPWAPTAPWRAARLANNLQTRRLDFTSLRSQILRKFSINSIRLCSQTTTRALPTLASPSRASLRHCLSSRASERLNERPRIVAVPNKRNHVVENQWWYKTLR
jgi:hypothetical protein